MRPLGMFSNLALVLSFLHPTWPQLHPTIRDNATVSSYCRPFAEFMSMYTRTQADEGHFCRRCFLTTITCRYGCLFVEPMYHRYRNGGSRPSTVSLGSEKLPSPGLPSPATMARSICRLSDLIRRCTSTSLNRASPRTPQTIRPPLVP